MYSCKLCLICHQSTKFVFNTQLVEPSVLIVKSHQSTKFVFNTQHSSCYFSLCFCHQSTKFVFNTQRNPYPRILRRSHQSTKFVFNTQLLMQPIIILLVTNLQNSYSIHNCKLLWTIRKCLVTNLQNSYSIHNCGASNHSRNFSQGCQSPIYKIRIQYTTPVNCYYSPRFVCHQSTKFVFNTQLSDLLPF